MSHRGLARTPPPSAIDDPLGYWWPVCRGAEIVRAFHAAPEPEAWRVVARHPALLLPEVVDAAERTLGRTRELRGLREMHHTLRGSPAYAAYHRLLASTLAHERRGSRRINLERALTVIKDVRRAANDPASDPADARTEQEIRAALEALTPLPGAKPPAMHALFLDETELEGFRRGTDRRGTNPNLHDRAYGLQGGLTAGASEWLGNEAAAIHRVVDARWVFASTKAAKAYLDTPATQLIARDGLGVPAVLPIADGAHAWSGSDLGGRARQCLLFRVDRVVARLDVTEGPKAAQAHQTLARSQLLPYAELIARRVRRVLAPYWLAIGGGTIAAQKLMHAPARKAEQLLAEYPILLLPEFPTAMASLGDTYRAAADRLAIMQGNARSNWQTYRETLRALVRLLLDEPAGEPRVNADAAQRLIAAHRRLDSDHAWVELEAECSARASGTPATTPRAGA
jgi:hypothetical protein